MQKITNIEASPLQNPIAERELKRYLRLALELQQPLTMFSTYIDEVWHMLLDSDARYSEWCLKNLGQEVGHVPSGTEKPVVLIDWVKAYESRYGKLPLEWFANESGEIDTVLLQTYERGEPLYASWQCGPAPTPPKNNEISETLLA